MSRPVLSIIIVSYNTQKVTLDCLKSITKFTHGLNYEVIVVDNNSKDNSVEVIRRYSSEHPEVSLIESQDNLGFGRGNNLGAKQAKGDYLLFLNSDTLIFDNVLETSVDLLKSHPEIGVYSCGLLNADRTPQSSGGYFPTFGRLIAWQFFLDDLPLIGPLFKSVHPHDQDFSFMDRLKKTKKTMQSASNTDHRRDWVTGAFMIVPAKVFKAVDGFDENIFMYTEELELCFRISKLGYTTFYQNQPAIVHLGGASGGSFLALTSEIQNMIYFWKKHMPLWQLPFVRSVLFLGSLLRLLIFGIIKGDDKARRTYFRALRLVI